jgi:hypothetical protein
MNQPELLALAPWVLATATGGVILGVCLPYLVRAIGLDGWRTGSWGGPSDLDPEGKDALYADFYRQLLDLGFEPAGVTWEKVWGKPKIVSFAFLHRQHGCRASVWRLLGGDYRVYLSSQFRDGAAILTANYSRPLQSAADYLAHGIPTTSLALLLAAHCQAVEQFQKAGRVLWKCNILEDIDDFKRAYHFHPVVRKRFLRDNWSSFASRAMTVGLIPMVQAAVSITTGSLSPLTAWLVALVLAVSFMLQWKKSTQVVLRTKTAEQRAADAARARVVSR